MAKSTEYKSSSGGTNSLGPTSTSSHILRAYLLCRWARMGEVFFWSLVLRDPGILLAPEEELGCVRCTTVVLLSTLVFSASSEAVSSVRPMEWETGVIVSSTLEVGISLDCCTGLLSLDIILIIGWCCPHTCTITRE